MSDRLGFPAIVVAACVAWVATPAQAYDWLQFNGGPAHSGNNTAETIISAANVASLTEKFKVGLPNIEDGAPVFLEGVTTAGGVVRDLLFVTTTDGYIVALDGQTGATVWQNQYGPNGCTDSNGSTCYTTSSPAIDPNRQSVYSYGLDGNVHKYAVGTGAEVTTGGWPVQTTRKANLEKASAALATATSNGTIYLYVAHGGYIGDNGDYQGHLTAINVATAAAKVFNAMCSNQAVAFVTGGTPDCAIGTGSAIWGRPGAIYDAGTDLLFIATGNATEGTKWNGTTLWSESILKLHPNGTGTATGPLDSYTPTNVDSLDSNDIDLGSTSPAILPVPATSNVQHLALQGGKDSLLRLVDLVDLSGQGAPGKQGGEHFSIALPQGGEILSQPAVWVNPADNSTWVFVGNGNGLAAFELAIDGSGRPSLINKWHLTTQKAHSSPLIANDVLYFFGSGKLAAYAPTTGTQLWSAGVSGGTHWQSPIVANGVVYVTDGGANLTAFSVSSLAPAITSANSAQFPIHAAGTFTVTATGIPTPTLSESGALPNGVTFTAATGVLAGTPTVAGSFPLQFTASNGVAPDAVQAFTLTVTAVANPATLTLSDTSCAGFVLSGTPPSQSLACAAGAGSGAALMLSDPTCTSFTLSGTAPNQVLSCVP